MPRIWVDLNAVLNAVEPLVAAGFVRVDGSYAEVVPPPLANRLAARMIRGRSNAVTACFAGLSDRGRIRFMRRLLPLTAEEAEAFWANLLGDQGAFTTIDGIVENSRLFRFAAAANGMRAGPILLRLLESRSVDERRAIAGRARRDLIHAIEEMLFRDGTGEVALGCMALLAEAENETWSNNASGIFKEAFHPLHSQMPLPLPQRLAVLRQSMAATRSATIACLAADAAAQTSEQTAITLRHSFLRSRSDEGRT